MEGAKLNLSALTNPDLPSDIFLPLLAEATAVAVQVAPVVAKQNAFCAVVNRARGRLPVRLVYSRDDGCGVPGEGEV